MFLLTALCVDLPSSEWEAALEMYPAITGREVERASPGKTAGPLRYPVRPMTPAATDIDTLEIQCQNCGATLRVEPLLRTAECPYCASTSIVERSAGEGYVDPTFALGFVVARERAREICVRWIRSRGLFTRGDFKKAMPQRGRGLYMPAYLYGAVARSSYRCDIGENYTETYTTTDAKGNTVTRTRTVTEWRELRGETSSYVQDVLVTASKGVPNELLEKIEPFDLRALLRYTPAILSGWIAEEASLSEGECSALAHSESVASVHRMLGGFMPGDLHRNLEARVSLHDEVSESILLPVWVFAVRHSEEEPPVQILVNGQTGAVDGVVPRSNLRIAVAVLLVVALAVAVFVVVGGALG